MKKTLTNADKAYLRSIGILDRWWYVDFKSFVNCPEAAKAVVEYLTDYRSKQNAGYGLGFYGQNGVGKSHLLFASMLHILTAYRMTVQVIQFPDLVTLYKQSWYNEDSEIRLKSLLTAHVLAIEELGKGFHTDKEDAQNLPVVALDYVLRYRVQRRLPVWYTMNLKPSALKDVYTPDIASLFKQCAIPVNVHGVDYRDELLKEHRK
jgi:DNA replication protein DnaC